MIIINQRYHFDAKWRDTKKGTRPGLFFYERETRSIVYLSWRDDTYSGVSC